MPEKLKGLLINILTDRRVSETDASIVLDSMLKADCCGVSTHGIRMLPSYAEKLDNGFFHIGDIKVLKQSPSFTVVDSNNIIGAISAYKCTEIAIKKAKRTGLHAVFARNCNTFGAAFYYTETIERQGMIGLVCSNSPATMPAYNGAEPMLGTNPIAFACPSVSEGTVRFDMSTSVAAKSKIAVLGQRKEKLPVGWAVDCEGKPTVEPEKAISGFLLPMAGFKGYGLAMSIDIVAGLLAGAGYLNGVNKFYSPSNKGMNAGQLFIAIDPEQIYEGNFESAMDRYIRILRNSKKAGENPIVVPGDRSQAMKEKSLQEGIEITEETVEKLNLLMFDRGGGKSIKS